MWLLKGAWNSMKMTTKWPYRKKLWSDASTKVAWWDQCVLGWCQHHLRKPIWVLISVWKCILWHHNCDCYIFLTRKVHFWRNLWFSDPHGICMQIPWKWNSSCRWPSTTKSKDIPRVNGHARQFDVMEVLRRVWVWLCRGTSGIYGIWEWQVNWFVVLL
jgi:hypothetical protein